MGGSLTLLLHLNRFLFPMHPTTSLTAPPSLDGAVNLSLNKTGAISIFNESPFPLLFNRFHNPNKIIPLLEFYLKIIGCHDIL